MDDGHVVRVVDSSSGFELGSTRKVPKVTWKSNYVATHKDAVRCAAFSPDGRFAATGSADASIKLLDVDRMKNLKRETDDSKRSHASIKTFYEHTKEINDLDFHPSRLFLASASNDASIYMFGYGSNARKALRIAQVSQ